MLGYNGSVMAYGQTGAGKTYTLASMEADNVGMTPRALADIFNKAAVDVVHSYKVYMSYVQIYMEVIKDLLLPSADQLAIREDANGVFLSNVHEAQVRPHLGPWQSDHGVNVLSSLLPVVFAALHTRLDEVANWHCNRQHLAPVSFNSGFLHSFLDRKCHAVLNPVQGVRAGTTLAGAIHTGLPQDSTARRPESHLCIYGDERTLESQPCDRHCHCLQAAQACRHTRGERPRGRRSVRLDQSDATCPSTSPLLGLFCGCSTQQTETLVDLPPAISHLPGACLQCHLH
jgi:hypothetical protein